MKDIFIVDFDKTISMEDSTDLLMMTHNPEKRTVLRAEYQMGNLTILEYIKTAIESLNITEKEYTKTLREKMKVDKTFENFVKSGLDYRIISSGAKINILESLEGAGIKVDEKLVYSNIVNFDENKITMELPYMDKEKKNGVDKKGFVLKYQEQGKRVIFVGDGPSDYEAAHYADVVFAREDTRLIGYCEENNIDFYSFSDFNDLLKQYKEEICETE